MNSHERRLAYVSNEIEEQEARIPEDERSCFNCGDKNCVGHPVYGACCSKWTIERK